MTNLKDISKNGFPLLRKASIEYHRIKPSKKRLTVPSPHCRYRPSLYVEDSEVLIQKMFAELRRRNLVRPGDDVVVARLAPPNDPNRTNFITIRTVTSVPAEPPARSDHAPKPSHAP